MRLLIVFFICIWGTPAFCSGNNFTGTIVKEVLRLGEEIIDNRSFSDFDRRRNKSNRHRNKNDRYEDEDDRYENKNNRHRNKNNRYKDEDDHHRNKNNRYEDGDAGKFYSKDSGSRKNSSSKVAKHLIPRGKFFPKNAIKSICLSSDGSKVAYVARNNESDSIHIDPARESGSFSSVVSDNVRIRSLRFVGDKYIVYTCVDDSNHVQLKSVNLSSNKEKKDISPLKNAVSADIIAVGESAVIARFYDNNKDYITFRINVVNGSSQQIKKDKSPLTAIFDNRLIPQLWYKDVTNESADVYVNDGTEDGLQVDQGDPENMVYISKNGDQYVKLSFQEENNRGKKEDDVVLSVVNFKDGSQHKRVISGVKRISDCAVLCDEDGNPIIVTVNKDRKTNVALQNRFHSHINHLNRTFSGDWYIADTTDDRSGWLLCVGAPRKPNEYYYYDTGNMKTKRVAGSGNSLPPDEKRRFHSPDYIKIPSRDGSHIQGYLFKNAEHSVHSPLIIMFFEERFNWEFFPLVQLLLDRGYAVLAIIFPYRTENEDSDDGEDESEISPETEDIIEAVKWCFDKRIAKVGNVSILSEGKSATHAVRACSKHPKYFAGCMLVTPVFSERSNPIVDEDILSRFNRPLFAIGHVNDAGRYGDSAFVKKLGRRNISYIAYHKNPSDSLIAGMIERAAAEIWKSPHFEKISENDSSKFTALVDNLAILKGETNKKGNEKENDSAYGML
jgi:dipeptidyl aminopeptidase/acylaminoacyl peptidase